MTIACSKLDTYTAMCSKLSNKDTRTFRSETSKVKFEQIHSANGSSAYIANFQYSIPWQDNQFCHGPTLLDNRRWMIFKFRMR